MGSGVWPSVTSLVQELRLRLEQLPMMQACWSRSVGVKAPGEGGMPVSVFVIESSRSCRASHGFVATSGPGRFQRSGLRLYSEIFRDVASGARGNASWQTIPTKCWCGRWDSNPYSLRERDFKSLASTISPRPRSERPIARSRNRRLRISRRAGSQHRLPPALHLARNGIGYRCGFFFGAGAAGAGRTPVQGSFAT